MEVSLQLLPLCVLQSHSTCTLITRELIGHQHLALILTFTVNCVPKPVYNKVQTVMGVSRATGVHLLKVQTILVLCRTKKSLPHHNQQRACELPLGTQKIPNSPQQISFSSFTAQYSPLGYWQLRVLLLMGRNSLARIQIA